jgi:uncharacterized membrane protein SpoIIM required for sporulation
MNIPPVILQWLAEFAGTMAICIVILVLLIFLGHFIGGILRDRL